MKNPKTAVIFRILVAGYIVYLGVHNLVSPGEVGRSMLIVISSILFIASGTGYALFAYRAYKNEESVENVDDASAGESKEDADDVIAGEPAENANDASVGES